MKDIFIHKHNLPNQIDKNSIESINSTFQTDGIDGYLFDSKSNYRWDVNCVGKIEILNGNININFTIHPINEYSQKKIKQLFTNKNTMKYKLNCSVDVLDNNTIVKYLNYINIYVIY